jgi:hypothetical protein
MPCLHACLLHPCHGVLPFCAAYPLRDFLARTLRGCGTDKLALAITRGLIPVTLVCIELVGAEDRVGVLPGEES